MTKKKVRRWRMVPYGAKKMLLTSKTWHPNPEPSKAAVRQESQRSMADEIREALEECLCPITPETGFSWLCENCGESNLRADDYFRERAEASGEKFEDNYIDYCDRCFRVVGDARDQPQGAWPGEE